MKNSIQHLLSLLLLFGAVILATGCKKEETTPKEEEKITSLSIQLDSPQKGRQRVSVSFSDPSGIGGKQSTEAIILDANTDYTGAMTLLDQRQTPAKEVTADYEVTFQVVSTDAAFSGSAQQLQVKAGAASSATGGGLLHMDLKRAGQTQRVSFPILVRN